MFNEMRYMAGIIYTLPGALGWYGYDPLSFLRISGAGQLEAVLRFGLMAGVFSVLLTELLVRWNVMRMYSIPLHEGGHTDALTMVVTGPLLEETFYRLLGITAIYELTGSLALAVLISSVGFGFAHMWDYGPWKILPTIVNGLIFSYVYLTGGFVAAVIAHAVHNLLSMLW